MKPTMFVAAAILVAAPLLTTPLPAAQDTTMKKGDQAVTVSGCVQREADYRRAADKGKGGVAGTGLGVENEYVVTNLSMTGGDSKMSGITASTAYELTGANEKLAGPHVGHRVEIAGVLKAADVGPAGKPTGGATAGRPPRGVDVASKDLQLRELEVTTVKMISAKCP